MGADQNTPIYFIDNSLEEVQVAHIRERRRGVDARRLDGGDHEVGRQHVPRRVPCLVAARAVCRRATSTTELKAQNIGEPPQLKTFYDVAADLGGRIIRDKLWFYGGVRETDKERGDARLRGGCWTGRPVFDRR